MIASGNSHPRRRLHRSPHFRCGLPDAYIEIGRGRAANLVRPIDAPVFLVGSGTDCDLVLGDQQFPDLHFYLFRNGGVLSMRKLADAPEITVNGRLAESTILYDGDRLRTGPYEFYLRSRENVVTRKLI